MLSGNWWQPRLMRQEADPDLQRPVATGSESAIQKRQSGRGEQRRGGIEGDAQCGDPGDNSRSGDGGVEVECGSA